MWDVGCVHDLASERAELRAVEATAHVHRTVPSNNLRETRRAPTMRPVRTLAPTQRTALVDSVLAMVQELSGSTDASADTPFFDAGLDSVGATQLVEGLERLTGSALSPTLVFEHSTPRAVVAHLLGTTSKGRPTRRP